MERSKVRIIRSFLSLSLLTALLGSFSACKKDKDPEPTGAEVARALLTNGTWGIESVTVDGTSQTGLFTGFTLQFSSSTYTTTNGAPVWPSSGSWSFSDDSGKTIARSDGLIITVDDISETSLKLTLTWNKTTLGSGRTSSIKGIHVFLFAK